MADEVSAWRQGASRGADDSPADDIRTNKKDEALREERGKVSMPDRETG